MKNLAARVDHMAYVTFDMRRTVEFWTKVMGLTLVAHVFQELVPSTREYQPYLHLFFRLDDGSDIAFFQIRGMNESPQEIGICDSLRHLSLEVATEFELSDYRERLTRADVAYSGPHQDAFGTFITFYDPNDVRTQIRVPNGSISQETSQAHEIVDAWVADHEARPRVLVNV
jgi:glyoxylase I family protein